MRHRIVQSSLVVALALACVAAGASAASAAGWVVPATPLAPAANGPSGAVVAVNAVGDGVAAWTADDGDGIQSLLVATRPFAGAWSAPAVVAEQPVVDAPAVTIDAAGTVTVVWIEQHDPGPGVVAYARSSRRDATSGAWSAPHYFTDDPLNPSGTALPLTRVRADANGNVIAAWVEGTPGFERVHAAVADTAGTWQAAQLVSDSLDVTAAYARPQIAPDASGGALISWTAQRNDDPWDYAIQTSRHLGSGVWGEPSDVVTTSESVSPVRLTGTDDGEVVATWFQGAPAILMGATRTAAGTWTVEPISADVAPACEPLQALGSDTSGGATVVWKAQSSDGLESVRLTAGGWEPSAPVFAARAESVQDAAIDRGTLVLVAHDTATNGQRVLGIRRAGTGWSTPTPLGNADPGTSFESVDVAANAAGDALAGWTATAPLGAKSVWVAPFDTDRPPPVDPPPVDPPPSTPPPTTPPATTPPATTPPPSAPPSPPRASPPPGSTVLVRPRIGGARNGVVTLARGLRTVKLTVRNPNAVELRGSTTLTRLRSGRRPALTLASHRGLVLPAGRRTTVSLRLSGDAVRALRSTAGHRLVVRVALRLRAADGRRTSATLNVTLDARARFGGTPSRTFARMSC